MRLLLAGFVLLLAFSRAAQACTGEDEFVGREAAQSALDGRLTCTDGAKASVASLRLVPIFQCPTSPVRGDIEIFGATWNLRAVKQISSTQFSIQTDGLTIPLACMLDRPVLPKADLTRAKEAADYMYARAVGYTGTRVLDYMHSEIDQRDYRSIGRVEFQAKTERYDRSSASPYKIRVELVDGKVISVALEPIVN